jgi:hypothetical protein
VSIHEADDDDDQSGTYSVDREAAAWEEGSDIECKTGSNRAPSSFLRAAFNLRNCATVTVLLPVMRMVEYAHLLAMQQWNLFCAKEFGASLASVTSTSTDLQRKNLHNLST